MTNGERLLSTESSELRRQEVKLYEATGGARPAPTRAFTASPWTRKYGLEVPL